MKVVVRDGEWTNLMRSECWNVRVGGLWCNAGERGVERTGMTMMREQVELSRVREMKGEKGEREWVQMGWSR